MKSNNQLYTSVTGIFLAITIVGILIGVFIFDLDTRWIYVLIVITTGYVLFYFSDYKELRLIQAMLFFLPFGIGFVYQEVVKFDTVMACDIILSLLYVNWFFERNRLREQKFFFPKIYVPAVLMIGWSVLSGVFAVSKLSTAIGVFFTIKAFLFAFFLVNKIHTKKYLFAIINILILGIGIQGLWGIAQRILVRPLGLAFLGEGQQSLRYNLSRVHGSLLMPNQYAAYLILLLPLAVVLFIYVHKKTYKIFYFVMAFLASCGLLLSLSRSAWLGFLSAILIMVLLHFRSRGISFNTVFWVLIMLFVLAALYFAFQDLIALRIETAGEEIYRKVMIQMAFSMILKNPILGVGLYNYQYHSWDYFAFWHPVHNCYLRLAAETGIPGLFFFLWMIYLVYRNAFRGLMLKDRFLNAVSLGVIGGYTAFLIAVMFGPEYSVYRQKVLFWVVMALSQAVGTVYRFESRKSKVRAFKKMRVREENDISDSDPNGNR